MEQQTAEADSNHHLCMLRGQLGRIHKNKTRQHFKHTFQLLPTIGSLISQRQSQFSEVRQLRVSDKTLVFSIMAPVDHTFLQMSVISMFMYCRFWKG